MSSPAAPLDASSPSTSVDGGRVVRYLVVLAELAGLLWIFHLFHVESPAFFQAALIAFAAFALHYWLPRRAKEPAFAALSLGSVFFFFPASGGQSWPMAATGFVGLGGLLVYLLGSRLRWVFKALATAIVICGAATLLATTESPWQADLGMLLGTAFGFRGLILLYDLRHMKEPPPRAAIGAYFFMLPNWALLLFPVVDWQTMRKGFLKRDALAIAQDGVRLILRGMIHLVLYRFVYHLRGPVTPDAVASALDLGRVLVMTYLLYLRVSGTFHIAIGILHLFGYDLPETHRHYLLSQNLDDFWRRINIYWKDFMVKVFWLPVYFKLRRSGDVRAQVVATAVVFTATWFLHGVQFFWLQGRLHFTATDGLFWAILGGCVMASVARGAGKKPSPPPKTAKEHLVRASKIVATFAFIIVLWTLWEAPSLAAFLDLMSYWR